MQPSLRQRLANPTQARPKEPVPIALVITELNVGGAEKALVALATQLDRQRWQPKVFCLSGPGPLVQPIEEQGIPVACLNLQRHQPVQGVYRLARALQSFRPRLVQSFLFHANIASRLASPLAGRPWVVAGIRVAERAKLWHRWLEWITSRMVVCSVCVSNDVAEFSKNTTGLDPNRLTVIPNGVDPLPFDQAHPLDRTALGVPASSCLAIFVGRLTRQKGLMDLVDACSIAVEQIPSFHLLVVGDGPDQSALQNRIIHNPTLKTHIHWLGQREDVPALLKTADLLVSPSLWEGMPNAILEAMAARRAVIATRVEGSRELVLDGQTGWLVPPGNPCALAEALIAAAADQQQLVQFGCAGRIRIETNYTTRAVIQAYDQLWSTILGFRD
jgi:glycosyltransferase involved in cell wall biosynthesis